MVLKEDFRVHLNKHLEMISIDNTQKIRWFSPVIALHM